MQQWMNEEIFSIVSMNTETIVRGIYQSINMFAFCEWLYFGTNKKYEDQRKNEGEYKNLTEHFQDVVSKHFRCKYTHCTTHRTLRAPD